MTDRDRRGNPDIHKFSVPFPKGKSPNPGGRPRASIAMAQLIREKTGDGVELVDFALAVLRGGWTEEQAKDGRKPAPDDDKSRRWAADWLSDRGFGKPIQDLDVTVAALQLTPDQAAMLEALKLSPHERKGRIAELKAKAIEAKATEVPALVGTGDADRD